MKAESHYRILIPIGSFFPTIVGGTTTALYWLAKALCKSGHTLFITTTQRNLPKQVERDKWFNKEFGRIIYLSDRSHVWPYKMIREARRCLTEVDSVLLSSLFLPSHLIIAVMAIRRNKSVIWSVSGCLSTVAMQKSKIMKVVFVAIIRTIRGGIVFHSTSKAESEAIRDWIHQDVRIVEIPNYMEISEKSADSQPDVALLYVGRFHPIKALDRLITACAKSESFMTGNHRLLMIGATDTSYSRELKSLANHLGVGDKIEMRQFVSNPDELNEFYARAKFTVLVSHSENFGNVVLESLANGTPVIASHGTPWEALQTNRIGFWVSNEIDKLAETIGNAIAIPESEYKEYRSRARDFAVEQYDIHAHIGEWEEVFAKTIRNSINN